MADVTVLAAEEAAAGRAARDAIVELMDVLGIDVTAAEAGAALSLIHISAAAA